MTPEQRYMLDASGYLILRGAMSSDEVEEGRAVSWPLFAPSLRAHAAARADRQCRRC